MSEDGSAFMLNDGVEVAYSGTVCHLGVFSLTHNTTLCNRLVCAVP